MIADIGSTFARFALQPTPGRLTAPASWCRFDPADFPAAVRAYLGRLPAAQRVEHAAVAIANPVDGDRVHVAHHWEFSIEQARQQPQLDTLVVVNGVTALAMSPPRLTASALRQVGGGQAIGRSVIGLIGAGSAACDVSSFRARFEAKGRFSHCLAAIPIWAINAEQATFTGTAAIPAAQLRALETAPGAAILRDTATRVPTVSRILQLLVIDVLTVGAAMRRGMLKRQTLRRCHAVGRCRPADLPTCQPTDLPTCRPADLPMADG